MKVFINMLDRNGKKIELNTPVAMLVHRCSSSTSTWWHQRNRNHFNFFWIPGIFKLYTNGNRIEVLFYPDEKSLEALKAPMGKETDAQNVDYLNIDYFNPGNFDTEKIPESGRFSNAAD